MKNTQEMRQFASVYQLLVREEYNIALVMAGLPQYVSELQNDDVLTFLLRSARITLGPLDLWEVRESYRKAFEGERTISEETLLEITKLTRGYAYAFQLLGYDLWNESDQSITDDTVGSVIQTYKTDLFRNAYVKIFQSLSDMERSFLRVMAEKNDEDVRIGEIGRSMGKKKNYVSVYRKRLLAAQVIVSPARGVVRFTLPFFSEFIRESEYLYV